MRKFTEKDLQQYTWMIDARRDVICISCSELVIFLFLVLLIFPDSKAFSIIVLIAEIILATFFLIRRTAISFGKIKALKCKIPFWLLAFQCASLLLFFITKVDSILSICCLLFVLLIHIVSFALLMWKQNIR